MELIDTLNDWLWSYVLIGALLLAAFVFTFWTRGVQIRMLPDMIRLLFASSKKAEFHEHEESEHQRHHTVSSFQAFAVSIAGRVGTGNIAGVAIAIAMGGPGAVFWMWVIAFFGAATAFV